MTIKRSAVWTRVRQWLASAASVVLTTLIGMLLSLLFIGELLPIFGAMLMMNAGVTSDMTMVTVLVMVLIPELMAAAISTIFVVWVTRGSYRWLRRMLTKKVEE